VLFSHEIGKGTAKLLEKVHEKENYQQYKNSLLEGDEAPDKVLSEMNFFNNNAGLSFTQKGISHPKDGLIYTMSMPL